MNASTSRATRSARVWCALRELVLVQDDRRLPVAATLGLSAVRIRLLQSLLERPLIVSELAQRVGSDPPYSSVLVQDLAARGLVLRSEWPSDRRVKTVALTDAGRAAAELAVQIEQEPTPALARLAAADLAELDRLLQLLLAD